MGPDGNRSVTPDPSYWALEPEVVFYWDGGVTAHSDKVVNMVE